MAKGRKTGGRVEGVPNKATTQKELLAARIMAEHEQKPGRKLAKEVLDDFMHLFMGLAAQHQPLPPGVVDPSGATRDEVKFVQYANMAREFARDLVKFQSPTFGMVKVSVENRFPLPGDGVLPVPPAVEPGQASPMKLTPSQAYRLMRDADVIDIESEPAAAPKVRKVANGS